MLGNNQSSLFDHPSKVFIGVRFVLFGFDPLNKANVLKKLVDGGGVEAGQLDPNCTHVIVHRIVLDDPICVAARSNGMTLVTGLWVDHSFDVGMPVDPTSIMYRPLKDLNGIPGARSLIICLTGYQRQDREDIMTMVGLMGSLFSKPLVAHKVTHLICYKFEGEKYELAKKMKKIKLVNHQWLEDCLRAWEILSEANYDKCGYELETVEAEAKDSEEEAEGIAMKQYAGRTPILQQPFMFKQEVSGEPLNSSASKNLGSVMGLESVNEKGTSDQMPSLPEKQNTRPGSRDTDETSSPFNRVIPAAENDPSSTSKSERSPTSHAAKFSVSYSRKTPRRTTPPMHSGEIASSLSNSVKMSGLNLGKAFDMSSSEIPQEKGRTEGVGVKTPSKESALCSEEAKNGSLSEKRRRLILYGGSKLQKTGYDSKAQSMEHQFVSSRAEGAIPEFLANDPVDIACRSSPGNSNYTSASNPARNSPPNKTLMKSSSSNWKSVSRGSPISKTIDPEGMQEEDMEAVKTYRKGLKKIALASKTDNQDVGVNGPDRSILEVQRRQNDGQGTKITSAITNLESGDGIMSRSEHFRDENHLVHNDIQDILIPTSNTKRSDIEKSPNDDTLELQRSEIAHSDSNPNRKKMVGKKFLGPKQSLGKEKTKSKKGSIYLKKGLSRNDSVACSTEVKATADLQRFEMVPEAAISDVEMVLGETDAPQLGNFAESKSACLDDETEPPEDKEEVVVEEKTEDVGPDNTNVIMAEGEVYINVKGGTEHERVASGKKSWPGHSPSMENNGKGKTAKGTKRSLSKSKKKDVPSMSCITTEKGATKKESVRQDKNEEMEVENETIPSPTVRTRKQSTVRESQNPTEEEKENMLVHVEMVLGETDDPQMGNLAKSKSACVDDETEPREDKEEVVVEEKTEDVGPDNTVVIQAEGKVDINVKGGTEHERVASGKKSWPGHSSSMENHGKGKTAKGTKRPLSKSKKKDVPSMSCVPTEKGASKKESVRQDKNEKMEVEKETIPSSTVRTKKQSTVRESHNPAEEEKENMPVYGGDGNRSHAKKHAGGKGSNVPKAAGSDSLQRQCFQQNEPVWFILSGHRLQRKEFQLVIKRLKGRVCRDSHQWSYQATHFIVPDPIRRTEKFFAAAASGRWILKTEYLTASNQAGKFLSEEPYEWYKNGLNEDGAINLEAPRKWHVLKEKTGHGAFYGMRIIIYGECIAPPLDTLKRVVKAGDGTILATSPPYTRFLKSGVDFAVVSPGMPRVDMWVQEFLRHEIPCIVPDYLVEYVCKPGYSLERHVQYNTNAWAEKSFKCLKNRLEETVEPSTPPSDNDVPCQVCGLYDRGDVMLICGDESGSTGCGVGIHIDCCDPPLEDVPEEDWFCPKCSKSTNSKSHRGSAKKRTSVSKRK